MIGSTPNLEGQGLSFVRSLPLDQFGNFLVEPKGAEAPAGIVLGIIKTYKLDLHYKVTCTGEESKLLLLKGKIYI